MLEMPTRTAPVPMSERRAGLALPGAETNGTHLAKHVVRIDADVARLVGKDHVRFGPVPSRSPSRHTLFAWLSLFWVAFTDLYIQLVSRGVITDLNTWS